MVVLAHCSIFLTRGGRDPALLPFYGPLGVAIFFVISGFIMYHTSRETWDGRASTAVAFFGRRLHRIVPLYWLLTSAQLALVLFAAMRGVQSPPALRDILFSYLFIPYGFTGLAFVPILAVGWTLDYEMFFYALFALALLLPKRAGMWALVALLAGLVALGQWASVPPAPLAALIQPIVLLFAFGILLGWAAERIARRLPPGAGGALLALLIACSPLVLWLSPPARTQLWFGPGLWAYAFAIVAVAAFTRAPPLESLSKGGRFLLLLGDASYFLYLVHPLVMQVASAAARRLGVTGSPGLFLVAAVALLMSITAAIAGHLLIEKRLSRWTAGVFGRKPAADPGGQVGSWRASRSAE